MILEIMNSCLTHRLHHNPHLVYSLLYQREVFDPFKTNPSLMDLIGNIDNVRACLSVCLSVCLSAYLSVCLLVCLFVCMSVCLSACLPACLLSVCCWK